MERRQNSEQLDGILERAQIALEDGMPAAALKLVQEAAGEALAQKMPDEVREFAWAMVVKLTANRHKKDKGQLPPHVLIELLRIEVQELHVALMYQSPQEAMDECADVANFAMLIYKRLRDVAPKA